jgi:Zn-dependent protease
MIHLFRLRGIPVRFEVGWLIIVGLVTWTLAAGYFPAALPDASSAAHLALALAAALLLFVSVFLHELSHAAVARRHGVGVSAITLHLFGGVAHLENDPPTPGAELRIAAVGPLASLTLGGICLGADRLMEAAWASALLRYLVVVNMLLGTFNLVPGFPLDGGRVLRAALWAWTGRLDRATRIASRTGSVVALALVTVGSMSAFAGEPVGGMWLVLLGLFLLKAAESSYELAHVRSRLEPLRVAEVMAPPLATISPDARLDDVVAGAGTRTSLPVARDGAFLGLVSCSELRKRARHGGAARVADATVTNGTDVVVVSADSAWLAFLKISRNRLGRVAVVDDQRLAGLVSRRSLDEAVAVEDAPAHRSSTRVA